VNRALRPVFLHVLVAQMSFAIMRPMVSYRALELGAGDAMITILAGSFSLIPLLIGFQLGRWSDRIGALPLAIGGSLIVLLAGAVALLAPNVVLLLVCTAMLGFGHLAIIVAQQSLVPIHGWTNLDRAFGLYSASAALGQMIGPPLAAIAIAVAIPLTGSTEGVLGIVAATLLGVPALVLAMRLTGAGSSQGRAPRRGVVRRVLAPRGMMPALLSGAGSPAALDLLLSTLPVWAESRDISFVAVGWLLAIRAGTTFASRVLLDLVIRWIGRTTTVVVSMATSALAFAALPFVDFAGCVVLVVAFGLGAGFAQPMSMSWVSRVAPQPDRGAALGLRMTVNRFVQVALPLVVGLAFGGAGINAVFFGVAAAIAFATVATFFVPWDAVGDAERPPSGPDPSA
jgi:MFS family permease